MFLRSLYYAIKPMIPRTLQVALRRRYAAQLLKRHSSAWPINASAANRPDGWPGWPDGKEFAFVLTHDVETERGQNKCPELMNLERGLGFRSSFNFVPKRYNVSPDLRKRQEENGFEVGVHGLYHDGKYFDSKDVFDRRVSQINGYLKQWNAVGFRSPSMLHRLDWFHQLDIRYDASTFDTDPFEPQPEGIGTIFPFWVPSQDGQGGYVELPYTLPQDMLLFVILQNRDIRVWKEKLKWIADNGGMALLITHPDYMVFDGGRLSVDEYPAAYYRQLLEHVKADYGDRCWHALPRDVARYVARLRNKPMYSRPRHAPDS